MKPVKSGAEMVGLLELEKKATVEEFDKIVRKLTLDAFSDLLFYTPVDTGYARSNWRIAMNTAPDTVLKNGSPSTTYPAPPPNMPEMSIGDKVIIYNNTSYALYLERGSSNQAPYGMVEPAYYRAMVTAQRLYKLLSTRRSNV